MTDGPALNVEKPMAEEPLSVDVVNQGPDTSAPKTEQDVPKPRYGVRFARPSYKEAGFFTRKLSYGERYTYGRMCANTGRTELTSYSVKEFVESFDNGQGQGCEFLASNDLLMGIDSLIEWCEVCLGDVELARAVDEWVDRKQPLGGQIDTVMALFKARYRQYREVLECGDSDLGQVEGVDE